jgi:ribosomal protein S18 acetylase RimI-like enzyme
MHCHFSNTVPNRYVIPYDETGSEKFRRFMLNYVNYLFKNDSVSLTVRDPQFGNRLVGVVLNRIEHRQQVNDQGKVSIPKEMLASILLGSLHRDINLFDLYKTDKILNLSMIGVRSDYGRLGLGSELFRITMKIGELNGAAIVTEAVSSHTRATANKFAFETLKTIVYQEFELEDGSRPFASLVQEMGEHQNAHLMGRRF